MTDNIDRFWSYVDKSGGPEACWPWLRSRSKQGYGQFYPTKSKKAFAHRWLLGYLRGKPLEREPVGIEDACHHCDNPPCCNPAHLYVGTRKQNIGDAVQRSRLWMLKREACPQGHPYSDVNTFIDQRTRSRKCRTCRSASARNHNARRVASRTSCKNGHPWTADNILECGSRRKCRTCLTAHASRMSEFKRSQPRQQACFRGHVMDAANTYTAPSGVRRCRECDRHRRRQQLAAEAMGG